MISFYVRSNGTEYDVLIEGGTGYLGLTRPLTDLAIEHLMAPTVGVHHRNSHKRCPVCRVALEPQSKG